MTVQPFHHGNLRAVLLERAEAVLRETGVDGLSLRDLARQAGVSHGAPRSHFIDRQALLDALAERGFSRLTAEVAAAIAGARTADERFRHVGHAYVAFAVRDRALMDLMFSMKADLQPGAAHDASVRLFDTLDSAMGAPAPALFDGDSRDRLKMVFAATLQGVAALIASGRITPEQGDVLIDDALDGMLVSPLARRAQAGS